MLLAFFNVIYNAINTISEVRIWVPLSDDQKREKIFGESYDFSVFINANTTKDANILLYSDEGMPYFYSRYYSYPRHIYWYQNKDEYVRSKYPKKFDYVAVYNMNIPLEGYKKVATFSVKNSRVIGSLYKRI